VTKSTGLKSAKPGMSIHFSESGDPIYIGSAMCPEFRRKDWRSESCWLHPQAGLSMGHIYLSHSNPIP